MLQRIKREGKMPEEELLHDLIAMLVAGFDTSARSAGGVLYNLGQNPDCLKELVHYLRTELRCGTYTAGILETLLTELTPEKYAELDLLRGSLRSP